MTRVLGGSVVTTMAELRGLRLLFSLSSIFMYCTFRKQRENSFDVSMRVRWSMSAARRFVDGLALKYPIEPS